MRLLEMYCFHVKLGKDSSQIERKAKLMLGMGGNKRVVHGHKQLEAASPLLSNSMLCLSPVFLQFFLFQSMVKITIHYFTLHKQNQNYFCCCHLTFLLNDSGIFDLYKWLRYTLPIQTGKML